MKLKPHTEFATLDMSEGWHVPQGYPQGIEQKIICGVLDEEGKIGNRTRFLRFAPGAFTTTPFVHDYAEEVFLVEGDMIVATGDEEKTFGPYTYAARPAGVYHGPFRSETGCLLLETHYYTDEK